jgi:hypothetical protein
MTNKIIALLLVTFSSCAYLDYAALPSLAKSIVIGPDDIIVDRDFFEAQPYSFVKIRIGKRAIAILSLSRIEDSRYQWVSSSGDKLVTLSNGQIAKFIADDFSFTLIPINSNPDIFSDTQALQYFIQLEDPMAMFSQIGVIQDSVLQSSDYLERATPMICLTEEVKSNSANWNYKNQYCNDEQSKMPLRTIQHFNPLYEPIELTFYYKY